MHYRSQKKYCIAFTLKTPAHLFFFFACPDVIYMIKSLFNKILINSHYYLVLNFLLSNADLCIQGE